MHGPTSAGQRLIDNLANGTDGEHQRMGETQMRTTKLTVITLDAGDEIEVHTKRADGSTIRCTINAATGEDDDTNLRIVTQEISWVTGPDIQPLESDDNGRTERVLANDKGENATLTITLV